MLSSGYQTILMALREPLLQKGAGKARQFSCSLALLRVILVARRRVECGVESFWFMACTVDPCCCCFLLANLGCRRFDIVIEQIRLVEAAVFRLLVNALNLSHIKVIFKFWLFLEWALVVVGMLDSHCNSYVVFVVLAAQHVLYRIFKLRIDETRLFVQI